MGKRTSFRPGQAAAGLGWPVGELARRAAEASPEEVREAARRIVPDTTFFLRGAAG